MFTGITSWTIGSTKAPPPSTTRVPPRPVRTKLRSLEERRYSQCSSHTTTATTIATTMRPRRKLPNCAPLMMLSRIFGLSGDGHELPGPLRQRDLGRQALHAGGAVEAVAVGTMAKDVAGVLRLCDGPAVAQHDHLGVHPQRGLRPCVDAGHAVVQSERRLRADRSAGGEAHVTDDDVGARLRHLGGFLLPEDVGGRQQIERPGRAYQVDLVTVAHAGFLEVRAEHAVDEAHRRKVLHA